MANTLELFWISFSETSFTSRLAQYIQLALSSIISRIWLHPPMYTAAALTQIPLFPRQPCSGHIISILAHFCRISLLQSPEWSFKPQLDQAVTQFFTQTEHTCFAGGSCGGCNHSHLPWAEMEGSIQEWSAWSRANGSQGILHVLMASGSCIFMVPV